MKSKIFIRADGNNKIGLGHIVRCLALAQTLRNDFEISFYSKHIPTQLKREIIRYGIGIDLIENESQFLKALNSDGIVVLDGYHFDSEYQREIKTTGCKLVCIDDLYEQDFFADLIINHSACATEDRYQAQPWTKYALGLEYALIRPSFIKQAKKKRSVKEIKNVLICVGGADRNHYTEKILRQVTKFKELSKIYVITGSAYNDDESLKYLESSDSRISLNNKLDEKSMLNIMRRCDLAIVPASGIILEAISCSCRILTFWLAENQKDFHDYLVARNMVTSFGDNSKDFNKTVFLKRFKSVLNDKGDIQYHSLRDKISQTDQNLLQVFKSLDYS